MGRYKDSCLIALVVFAAFLFFFPARAGVHGNIDSLKKMLNTAMPDTTKVKVLITLSESVDRADTAHKLSYGREALQLAEKIKWNKGIGCANLALGDIYRDCSKNYLVSFKYYERTISLAKISGDKLNQALAYTRFAGVYEGLAQYSKALDKYRDVLALKLGPEIEMGVLGNMGGIYTAIGDYAMALACYDSSLKVSDESIRIAGKSDLNDTLQKAGLLITIGDIYLAMLQYDKALGNYNNARELISQTNMKLFDYDALIGMGKAYRYKKDAVKAIEYYTRALEDSKALNNENLETVILNELGNVYLEEGDVDKAMEFTQSALKMAEGNTKYYKYLPVIYTTLGKVYTAQKNYKQAVAYLRNAVNICGKNSALVDEKDAWEALSNTYGQMNQPALAYDAYRRFIAIRDSVYNIQKANELTQMDLKTTYSREKIVDSLRQKEVYNLQMQKQQVYTYSGYAGLVMVLLLAFFIYRGYNHEKKANVIIRKASETIREEKQVSENLLLNILPEDVAKELKLNGRVNAKLFDHVTVLFTDFANFTSAAERFTPQGLVAELDTCFKAFDRITQQYNVEKIKTVGDAYLAVSGLPNADAAHATNMVRAALAMRDFMVARQQELGDRTFEMRIGVNSGMVVAGIVGEKKFAYDIWGDTVNVASRLQQYGEEGKVNISAATYELIKDKFNCTDRGEIDAKHKGKMSMYFVEGYLG